MCVICKRQIAMMVSKGSLFCSGNCEKASYLIGVSQMLDKAGQSTTVKKSRVRTR
jgi:hypothetical protein